jgi:hypothetical protein
VPKSDTPRITPDRAQRRLRDFRKGIKPLTEISGHLRGISRGGVGPVVPANEQRCELLQRSRIVGLSCVDEGAESVESHERKEELGFVNFWQLTSVKRSSSEALRVLFQTWGSRQNMPEERGMTCGFF